MEIPLWQRLLAPLVYLLPWSDAIPFGLGLDGVFNQVPLLRLLIVPAIPFIQLNRGVPFGGLLLFFVLFLAVVRNPKVPYFLRFNTLQALLTDIVLVVLSFAFGILLQPVAGGSLLVGTLSSRLWIHAARMGSPTSSYCRSIEASPMAWSSRTCHTGPRRTLVCRMW